MKTVHFGEKLCQKISCGKNDRFRHGQWGKVMGFGEMEGMLDVKVSPAGLVQLSVNRLKGKSVNF